MRLTALLIALWALTLPLAATAQGTGVPGGGIPATSDLAGEPVAGIRVEGTRRVEPEAVRRAMRTRVGERIDPGTVREDLRRIFSLGYFDDIRIDGEPGPEGVVLVVTVVERPAIREVRIEGNDEIRPRICARRSTSAPSRSSTCGRSAGTSPRSSSSTSRRATTSPPSTTRSSRSPRTRSTSSSR